MRVHFTFRARLDLRSIGDGIAVHNPYASIALVRALSTRCLRLSEFPESAPRLGPDFPTELRRLSFRGHLIFYVLYEGTLYVLRIVRGSRDMGPILAEVAARAVAPKDD